MKQTQSLLVKLIYIALQGVFLPLVLLADGFKDNGQMMLYGLALGTYEALVILDALLFMQLFGTKDRK